MTKNMFKNNKKYDLHNKKKYNLHLYKSKEKVEKPNFLLSQLIFPLWEQYNFLNRLIKEVYYRFRKKKIFKK